MFFEVVRSTFLFFSGSGGPPGTNANFHAYLGSWVNISMKNSISDDFFNMSGNRIQMKIRSSDEVLVGVPDLQK